MSAVLVGFATFLAAAVEWVEALTIILAVGTSRGWKSSFAGMIAGLAVLTGLVLIFGVGLTAYVPIAAVRTVVGVFLLLFGLKWLYKAILRSSGLKALHDEAKTYRETTAALAGGARSGTDWIGFGTSFNGVFLEGLEVIFIVIALGGLNSVPAAAAGAIVSLAVVAVAGIIFRHPLTRVPENTMKYVVGIMLTAFGTFFAGEGIGVNWWHADLVILPLIALYAVASVLLVMFLKRSPSVAAPEVGVLKVVRAMALELWGLFVDDGALAIVTVAAILGVAVFVDKYGNHDLAGPLLAAGILVAIMIGLAGPARMHRARLRAAAATLPTGSVSRQAVTEQATT